MEEKGTRLSRCHIASGHRGAPRSREGCRRENKVKHEKKNLFKTSHQGWLGLGPGKLGAPGDWGKECEPRAWDELEKANTSTSSGRSLVLPHCGIPRRPSVYDFLSHKNGIVHDIRPAIIGGIWARQAAADNARPGLAESEEVQLRFASPLSTHPRAKAECQAFGQRGGGAAAGPCARCRPRSTAAVR